MLARKITLFTIYVVCIFLCVALGVVAGRYAHAPFNARILESGEVVGGDQIVPGGRINVLLLGLDKGGYRSDTIMLASFDVKTKRVAVLSIPRDTRVYYNGSYEKINGSVGHSGREQSAMQAVKQLTGVPIHYYVSMEFDGFRNMIDILGGVYIDVPRDMKYSDPYQNLNINLKKGYQLLDGDKAEQFMRYRSGYADADIGRIHAQQIFVKETIKQKLTLENISRASDIFAEMKQCVNTNYSIADLVSQVDLLKGFDFNNIAQFDLPGEPRMINDLSYWVCDEKRTQALMDEYFLSTPMPEVKEVEEE